MPVKIEKSVFIKDKEGKITILTETDQIAENTDITMQCDSPRCASRHDGKHVEISWNIDAVKADANALSDDFYRIVSVVLDPGNQTPVQKTFCGAQCARDYLQSDYVAPLSPREQALLMAQNQQAEIAKHKPAVNVIPFKPQGPVDNEVKGPAAVAQTFEDPAKDYTLELPPDQAPPPAACVGEQPTCDHCCEKCTQEPFPELPSDVTRIDPDEEVNLGPLA
jgi:hypothetical protein